MNTDVVGGYHGWGWGCVRRVQYNWPAPPGVPLVQRLEGPPPCVPSVRRLEGPLLLVSLSVYLSVCFLLPQEQAPEARPCHLFLINFILVPFIFVTKETMTPISNILSCYADQYNCLGTLSIKICQLIIMNRF